MKHLRAERKHDAMLDGGNRYCNVAAAMAAASIATSAYSANQQKKSAKNAANAQIDASEAGIAEQRRQFDAVQSLLSPYVDAGKGALAGQQDLIGLNGMDKQQAAIDGISNGAQFQSLLQQGENAMLQNASATGGLRGGNLQEALGQFRPQLLNQLIDQQYSRLGGLTSIGQNAAAGVGNAGLQTGNQITALLGQQGQARAGQSLALGQANTQLANGVMSAIGSYFGGGKF